jgi:hypothetical protein
MIMENFQRSVFGFRRLDDEERNSQAVKLQEEVEDGGGLSAVGNPSDEYVFRQGL